MFVLVVVLCVTLLYAIVRGIVQVSARVMHCYCNHVEELHDGVGVVNYYYHGKMYKIVVQLPLPGAMPLGRIADIYDENNENVTDALVPFMGPAHTFEQLILTPDMLGYRKLRFLVRIKKQAHAREYVLRCLLPRTRSQ
jgi:hypothetical protein